MKVFQWRLRMVAIALCLGGVPVSAAVTFESKTDVWPVMTRLEMNTVMKLTATVSGESTPVALNAFQMDLKGTTRGGDVARIDVYVEEVSTNAKGKEVRTPKLVGTSVVKTRKFDIPCSTSLPEGATTFQISVVMKDTADIDGRVGLTVSAAKVGGLTVAIKNATTTQRIGYAVAKQGDCNSKYYRIPGIARSPKTGTLVSVYDIRYNGAGDLPARIDVGFARSTNGGKTWTPTQVMMSTHKQEEFKDFGNGVGDPAILCDTKTGWFWVAALTSAKSGHPIWKSLKGDASPKNCGQYVLSVSKDDGKTWSKIINITEDVKRLGDSDTAEWGCLFQGPGAGITMADGTLVFPSQVWGDKGGAPHHGVLVYSKDNGKTWTSSAAMTLGGSESTVAEVAPGTLLLNTREGAGWTRMVGETKDLGATWTKHVSMSNGKKGKLGQPGGCQAALLALDKGKVLFFSNPNAGSRKNMTIKRSNDGGVTWSEGLMYDERGCAGYSSLAPADKKHLGILYEATPGSQTIGYLRIPFTEIQ